MWNFHVDDSAKGGYNIILVRDILKSLGLNLQLSKHIIEFHYGPLKGSTAPVDYLGTYEFKYLNTGKFIPE